MERVVNAKKTLSTHQGIDISKYQNLKSLLSNNCKGYKPKKSSILKWVNVENFLQNADDYTYLASKVNFFTYIYRLFVINLNYICRLFWFLVSAVH